MDFRRFGLPAIRIPAPESVEGLAIGSRLGRTGSVAACLVAGSLIIGACGAESDEATVPIDPDGQTEESTDGAGGDADPGDGVGDEVADAGSGDELSFGDPTDSGFGEVINTDVEPEQTPASAQEILSRPDQVLPEIEEQLDQPADGQEILDTVDVVDGAADVPADRDGRTRNSSGELVLLDDAASLACAHAEVALSQLDVGNTSVAIERIWQAADRAGASTVAAIGAWQEPLAEMIADGNADDVAPLIGFLTVCTEGGYEL